jgi:hypothetical protein
VGKARAARSIGIRSGHWLLAGAAVTLGLMWATPATALGGERTLGPMVTNSGKSCTITVAATSTTRNTVALSNIDWLTQVSCSAGTMGYPLARTWLDAYLVLPAPFGGLPVMDGSVLRQGCAYGPADPCITSGTYSSGIPTTTYDFHGQGEIIDTFLNTGTSDYDWWTSWPSQCTASSTEGLPHPDRLRCPELVTLVKAA